MLDNSHFEENDSCPWCMKGGEESTILYTNKYDAKVVRCPKCGFVYSKKILNERGLKAYWADYESEIHNSDEQLYKKRQVMYKIEADFVKKFLNKHTGIRILDVGCAGGEFLDCFAQDGVICEGVEIGEEAYNISSKKYKIYLGKFPDIVITKKYDLIIFRGTIQYFIDPKRYFIKAMDLLNPEGLLYITSSPNANSICFNLFKDKFTLPVGVTDYWAYSEEIITCFLKDMGAELLCSHHFYLEGPYANPAEDIKKVAMAIEFLEKKKEIDFVCPPFFDNMLTLVYKKVQL